MHKRGLCRHAMSVRLSVCLSRSWILSKRVIVFSDFFLPLGSQTLRTKPYGDIPTATPLTAASNVSDYKEYWGSDKATFREHNEAKHNKCRWDGVGYAKISIINE